MLFTNHLVRILEGRLSHFTGVKTVVSSYPSRYGDLLTSVNLCFRDKQVWNFRN